MITPWPTERASRAGLVAFVVAAAFLLVGLSLTRQAFPAYTDARSLRHVLGGLLCLAVSGFAVHRIVRRREYPWLLGLAALALPFYEPLPSPYLLRDRVVMAVRDLALVLAAAWFLVRSMRAGDELERRIQLESLSWSYAVVLVALIAHALAADRLPPLTGPGVASALLGTWLAAWFATSIRYQR